MLISCERCCLCLGCQALLYTLQAKAASRQSLTGDACRHLKNKLSPERLSTIISEAVDIERSFLCEALPVDLIGMNARLMEQYIQFVADRLLTALGTPKLYHVSNPFDWMELLSLQCAPALSPSP